jgi:hypothetical protein
MHKGLFKIFRKRVKPFTFILSGFGLVLGLCLVLLCLQLYLSIVKSLSTEISKSEYIILSKDISVGNTIFKSNAVISSEELKDLQAQPFVEKLGVFIPNHYKVTAYAGGSLQLVTELFFESVPDEFVDNRPYNFRWEEGDDFLPIIVSEDFINLYNYGYAMSNGFPQISKNTASLVPLQVRLAGSAKEITMNARIVGYSERISSVLVPQDFMKWANTNISNYKKQEKVSRIIVKLNKKYSGGLERYLEDKSLLINSEKLGMSKISAIAKIVIDVLIIVGVLFVIFSFMIVLTNFSLILAEAKSDLVLLFQLGYKLKTLISHLFVYLMLFIGVVMIITTGLFFYVNTYLTKIFESRGISVTSEVHFELFYCMIFLLIFLLGSGLFSISRNVNRQL